jgi:CheY-like chemotaxis protein
MLPLDQLPILLVEDSDDDLFFFKRLLAKTGLKSALAVATDGQKAVTYLERSLQADLPGHPPIPILIFLDLKLPLKGGFEVLKWIRSHEALAGTVVVILSSSAETRDVHHAYEWGAQSYLVKYPEPAILADVIQRVATLNRDADLSTLGLPGLRRP